MQHYHLVCLKSSLDELAMTTLLSALRSDEWADVLRKLPGYSPAQPGQRLAMRDLLPWWRFRTPKRAPGTNASAQ